MAQRQYLQIPGPTNIPDSVVRAMARQMTNHRGKEFAELLRVCTDGMKQLFRTEADVLFFPSSGSGGLESAIVNTLSPGDRVLALVCGVFSERAAMIAESHGAHVKRLDAEWGQAVDPALVSAELKSDPSIRAVLCCQNETSTGVENDIQAIGRAIGELDHSALLIVDAVSSLALTDLRVDEWNVDVAVTASQKGLMLPPGMAVLAVSKNAWAAHEHSSMPRWYWNWKPVKKAQAVGRTAYTPPTALLFGLEEALRIIFEEGLDNVHARHKRIASAFRRGIRALGLSVLPKEQHASCSVTAVNLPDGVDGAQLSKRLADDHNVVIGGGLAKLQGRIFRVGHMGQISELDIVAIMSALELSLSRVGAAVEINRGVSAIQKHLA